MGRVEHPANYREGVSAIDLFSRWISKLSSEMEKRDAVGFAGLFAPDGSWKDILSFSWRRPILQSGQIAETFVESIERSGAGGARLAKGRTPPRFSRRSGRAVVEGWFDFDLTIGHGRGFARLVFHPGDVESARAWLLLTTLHEIKGAEEHIHHLRPSGEKFSKIVGPISWRQQRESEQAFVDRDPEVLIVGAGQSGLMLAARLRQMGADALVIDRLPNVGDIWRGRYNNLTIHNKICANHFPYMPFPPTWPNWLPKDMLADWLESYAKLMELNVWTNTSLSSALYDEATGQWSVNITHADGSSRKMRCPHLVLATGVSGGVPKKPDLPGLDSFTGDVVHSGEFRTGVDWAGKNALVIGTGNSGHDVAQDLYVSGAGAVTIMQRGATCVLSLEPSSTLPFTIYDEDCNVEDVDLMAAAVPEAMLIDSYKWITRSTNEYDRELLAKLNAIGFKTHSGADGTGWQLMYLRGNGGYYIDVGCSSLLIERKIGLIQHEDSDRFVPEGLLMKDGTIKPLDLVVLATGFESIGDNVGRLLGAEVAAKVGKVWGFDDDGNMRGMWTRTGQPGLWLMGGAMLEARINSRFLALEIIGSLKGLIPSSRPLIT